MKRSYADLAKRFSSGKLVPDTEYSGVISQLRDSVFNNGALKSDGTYKYSTDLLKYTVAGSGAGALLAPSLNFLTQDDQDFSVVNSIKRGAIFGGAVGGGVNLLPKLAMNTINKHGFKPFGHEKELKDEAIRIGIKSRLAYIPQKDLASEFKSVNSKNKKLLNDPYNYSKAVAEDIIDRGTNIKKYQVSSMSYYDKADVALREAKSSPLLEDMKQHYKGHWNSLSRGQKIGLASAYTLKGGFDSAYNHIVVPTQKFTQNVKSKSKPTLGQASATAFSLYGAYEAGSIINDVGEGDYSSAAVGAGLLLGGKLLYSQGSNLVHANRKLREEGKTWGDVFRASKYGAMHSKHEKRMDVFKQGVDMWTPEDEKYFRHRHNKYIKKGEKPLDHKY